MTYETSACLEGPTEPSEVLEKSEVLLLSRWNRKPRKQDIIIGDWIPYILIADLQGFLYFQAIIEYKLDEFLKQLYQGST